MRKIFHNINIYLIAVALIFAGCSHMVEDFKESKSTGNLYTVVEEFESLENDNFDSLLTKRFVISSNPLSYKPEVPEGFELEDQKFENNILSIKYIRKRITLTFNPNGGEWDSIGDVLRFEGKFGERLPVVDISQIGKAGAKFTGWTENPDATPAATVRVPETYPSENHNYYAVWDAVNSNYIVKIYEENLEYYGSPTKDEKYTLVAMDIGSGVPGQESNYSAIPKDGFERESFDQVTIKGVGEPSAVLEIFYNRKVFTYKFNLNSASAKWKNTDGDYSDDHSERSFTGKYGADFDKFKFKYIECVNDDGETVWKFEGWNEAGGKLDIKFTQDRQYAALWSKGSPEYKVRHLFELDEGIYSPDESLFPEEKHSAGSEIYTKAKAYDGIPGYYVLPFEQQKIKADGSTVVEIKYNRATVTVTLNANGGRFSNGAKIVKFTGKYPTDLIPEPSPPIKDGYVFVRWQSVYDVLSPSPMFPAKNICYEAIYRQTVLP